jgi:hypothetical protein
MPQQQPMNDEGDRGIRPKLTLFFGRFLNTLEEMDDFLGSLVLMAFHDLNSLFLLQCAKSSSSQTI